MVEKRREWTAFTAYWLIALAGFTGCQPHNTCCDYPGVIDEAYVHKYGVPVPHEDWDARGRSGKILTTLKSGVVVAKNYQKGILEGETTYTFPHSDTIEKSELYSNDRRVKETNYYRSGAPKQEIVYMASNAKSALEWYENGSPKSSEEYIGERLMKGEYYTSNYQTDYKINDGFGQKPNRDQYGHMDGVNTYENGELTMTTTYYSNGVPKEMIPYAQGIVDGQLKTFLAGGEPKTIEEWSFGVKNGVTTLFENGEKIAEVPYTYGLKNGVEKRFRNNVQLVEEITWINDVKHGPHTTYIGSREQTDWYFKGEIVTETAFERMTAVRSF